MAMNDVIEIDDYAADKGEGSASYIDRSREYFAIVYEYISDTKLERNAVQRQLDFFYRIGFHPCQAVKEENWQGPGILLDFGDYHSPVDPWFKALSSYHPCRSAEILVDRAAVEARVEEEEIRMRELEDQGIGPTEEEKRAQEKGRATAKTARYIEWGYQDKWHRSYFDRKSWCKESAHGLANVFFVQSAKRRFWSISSSRTRSPTCTFRPLSQGRWSRRGTHTRSRRRNTLHRLPSHPDVVETWQLSGYC
jgi:hypothetical protein